ncbi:hypothetical protein B0T16DRAFT_395906 [Cercophora newfieldiana]|uniref:FAD/NAD(P)-binding domain-containing protein n=1 Tax=Cercophora newfieldiana TaxID=92897 RepID=A0AA39YPN3_9PEZI|nr:hypothetical protein B0T16DRAFT_395906 [Cercophora newfieldiana]
MPGIEGYEEVWGRGVYHCLFCDGYEDRGAESVGVLAVGDMAEVQVAVHMARMAKRLSGRVTIYTDGDGELGSKLKEVIGGDGAIVVDGRRVVKLEKASAESGVKVLVHLDGGEIVKEGFLVHKPKTRVNGPFVSQLGLELTEKGVIKIAAPFNEASVKGVFAVGDCASLFPAVANAMAMGVFAAGGLAAQLQSEPVPEEDV